jgi:hypothetical protein
LKQRLNGTPKEAEYIKEIQMKNFYTVKQVNRNYLINELGITPHEGIEGRELMQLIDPCMFGQYGKYSYNDYFNLINKRKDWFVSVDGYIQADSLWDAYREGNIGERTFKGHSISIGDILIDQHDQEFVLTDQDFELLN